MLPGRRLQGVLEGDASSDRVISQATRKKTTRNMIYGRRIYIQPKDSKKALVKLSEERLRHVPSIVVFNDNSGLLNLLMLNHFPTRTPILDKS